MVFVNMRNRPVQAVKCVRFGVIAGYLALVHGWKSVSVEALFVDYEFLGLVHASYKGTSAVWLRGMRMGFRTMVSSPMCVTMETCQLRL